MINIKKLHNLFIERIVCIASMTVQLFWKNPAFRNSYWEHLVLFCPSVL